MTSGIFGVAVSGLNAAQAGLVTTGHNIANANTAGYHRQSVIQSAAPPQLTGSGFFGQGVNVESVVRNYSAFLDSQVVRAEARASFFTTQSAQLAQLDGLLADPAAGLSPALQSFFAAVNEVAANPASLPSRQSLLSSAQTLAARFGEIDGRLAEIARGVNSQLSGSVSSINSYATEIALLNERIHVAQSAAGQPPNDLLDQRDRLIGELNRIVGVSTVTQSDGALNVFIGTGQSLVVGNQATQLSLQASAEDPTFFNLVHRQGTGAAPIASRSLQSGSLGGLLAFREGALVESRDGLGRIATVLASTFNEQHSLGQDYDGAAGGLFFAAPQVAVAARASNTGNAVLAASHADVSALEVSSYRVTYSAGSFLVTRLSDNSTTTWASLPQTVDGFMLNLASGTPAEGDSFVVEPVRYGARNFSVAVDSVARIAAAAPIRSAAVAGNTGSATISAGSVNPPAPLNANLQQPVTINFTSPGTFNVSGTGTGNPVGLSYTPGADISYNGWTIRISGTPAAGDSFIIEANSGGRGDNRNALQLAALQGAQNLVGGRAGYQSAYSQIAGSVGARTREAQISAEAQDNVTAQARQAQQSLSGVNLDEEAANLIRYQQAYQASSKVVEVASRLFETLLGISGR
ncbi:MAG: flagellar hook-associated protein FlgK [Betaproteobacteria bacterium]|jgi:flagellar hook-associated protein 1 FlgK|nr:flagellar hook-associated protein FlgK [Betaproteobacteria bacterium]